MTFNPRRWLTTLGKYKRDEWFNIPLSIEQKLNRHLFSMASHPLSILKRSIEQHLLSHYQYKILDQLSPIVTTKQNFDDLLIPKDHPSRSKTDTFYINQNQVLRTHTSAHQSSILKGNSMGYVISGDVYRRDEIDPTHYPIFHQMEGLRLFTAAELQSLGQKTLIDQKIQSCHSLQDVTVVTEHLKQQLESLVAHLFPQAPYRWVDAYFPFTHPRFLFSNKVSEPKNSWELEIYYNDQWLEVLGCGIIQQSILDTAGHPEKIGWAFGLGLERLAMVLFEIPDIRLFWTEDQRFLKQFESGMKTKFKPYSKYPVCYKDISFWCGNKFHEHDFFEVVRSVGGDLVERVSLLDTFTKQTKTSKCFRIEYRSMDRTLTNKEIDQLHSNVVEGVKALDVELR